MEKRPDDATGPLCPSAMPEMAGAVIFGVVGGTARQPRLIHLVEPQPVTDETLALAAPVSPREVFRFAAPCAASACVHFDGKDCRLASRIVDALPVVAESLPVCRIRPTCRWWMQEGRAACMRCPQVVTESYNPSEAMRGASDPSVYPELAGVEANGE